MIQIFLARHVAFSQYYSESGLGVPVVISNFICGFVPVLGFSVRRNCDQVTQLSAVSFDGAWL